MTRYDFLKSMEFAGAALIATLTGCVHESDSVVNALDISPDSSTSVSTTTPVSSTATSITTAGSTTDLSTITNRFLTIDLTI